MARLDKTIARRVATRLAWLGENGEHIPHLPLKGRMAGLYKFRVGDYRIVYDLVEEESLIYVLRIGHRREIYC